MLRELKAKKAKFGFAGGSFGLSNVVKMGKFIEALENEHSGNYLAEEVGYTTGELRVYTDVPEVAEWLRNYKFN